jgi:high-affinity K+ transport system ATPase subunit B
MQALRSSETSARHNIPADFNRLDFSYLKKLIQQGLKNKSLIKNAHNSRTFAKKQTNTRNKFDAFASESRFSLVDLRQTESRRTDVQTKRICLSHRHADNPWEFDCLASVQYM